MNQPSNRLTLAVAGSRKTQGLVDSCKAADPSERILVLTYTSYNQRE
jgi:DNA helicase-2/ATP-dependent DNA helicase PcrA